MEYLDEDDEDSIVGEFKVVSKRRTTYECIGIPLFNL